MSSVFMLFNTLFLLLRCKCLDNPTVRSLFSLSLSIFCPYDHGNKFDKESDSSQMVVTSHYFNLPKA